MRLGAKTVPLDPRVALVLAQLAPIGSRRALLDSYRRESVCLTVPIDPVERTQEHIVEIAYSLRWSQLETDEIMGGVDPDVE